MTGRLLLSYVSITVVVLAVLVLPLGAGYADAPPPSWPASNVTRTPSPTS